LSETQLWECNREEHCADQSWVQVMIICDANAQAYAKCEDICQLLYSVKVFSEFESKAACLCLLWLSLSLHCRSLASHSSSVSASHLCLALSLHHTSFSLQSAILPGPCAQKYVYIVTFRIMVQRNINSQP